MFIAKPDRDLEEKILVIDFFFFSTILIIFNIIFNYLEEVAQVTESISVSEVKPSEKPSDPSEINLHDVATIF